MDEYIQELLFREGLKPASITKRAIAYTIDFLLICLLMSFAISGEFASEILAHMKSSASLVASQSSDVANSAASIALSDDLIMRLNSAILTLIMWSYIAQLVYNALFIRLYGATLGKMLMKIRVIDFRTLDRPSFAMSLIRAFVRIINDNLLCLGYLPAFFNFNRRTAQDYLSNSVVVDIRQDEED